MGSAMSCFDRWGKRAPDGALFTVKKSDVSSQSTPFSAPPPTASTSEGSSGSRPSKPKAATSATGDRPLRRRQTYSSNAKSAGTDMSSYDEGDDFEDSEENEELTTRDVRQQKLLSYRRNLTKVVKLKTHLFNATVKVTCSKDGKEIEWYKGQSEAGKKKPVGSMPVDKIISVKSQADNHKGLTITANNPTATHFSFTFKTKDERVSWQEQLESFMKFMAMI